ncbi:uncharacterized protein LOC121370702 [Gigantopelta aegis]|uniref:uncharacterized protein LOC121370702 n=1 Tax=Gigantopelta aegis TaxID=1735272 RepID=UPI001B888D46|nr:uncharacterized protein LOC121370702 [Gigantopelta aegis]
MASLFQLMLGTMFLVCVMPYIGSTKNTDSVQQEKIQPVQLKEFNPRSRRFLDDIFDSIAQKFLNELSTLLEQLTGERKEAFVRKMYFAVKDYANEGKEVFIKNLKIAIEELPGVVAKILDTLVPAFVNLVWSDDGSKPGFLKLRQMIYQEADKMGISGASHQVPGIMTSLVLLLITQIWRMFAN